MAALLLLLLAGPPAASREPANDLDQVVRGLESHYNRLQTLKVQFVQLYRAAPQAPIREEAGILYLKKPNRMRWEYTRPETKLFVSDGKTVYFYVPEDGQVTRMPAAESADLRAPLRFLLGRLNLRRAFGRVEWARDFAPFDPGNPVLRLWPKAETGHPEERGADSFRELLVEVDQQSRIRRLVIYEGDGARTEFRLSGEQQNPRLDARLFRFSIPPGVEVVDERSER